MLVSETFNLRHCGETTEGVRRAYECLRGLTISRRQYRQLSYDKSATIPMRRRFSAVFPRSMFFFIADGVKYKSANFFQLQ